MLRQQCCGGGLSASHVECPALRSKMQELSEPPGEGKASRMEGIAEQESRQVTFVELRTAPFQCLSIVRLTFHIHVWTDLTCPRIGGIAPFVLAIWPNSKVTGRGTNGLRSLRARIRSGSIASNCARACSRYPTLL